MKIVISLHLVILSFSSVFAQVGSPSRTVLHTLGKNEILYYDEYYTFQSTTKNGFSCVIEDTISHKQTLIFNSKIIHTFHWLGRDIFEIDLSKENGYIFRYWESDKAFVNFRGKVEGPFESVTNELYDLDNPKKGMWKIPEKNNFFYKLGGDWYSYYEGKAQMLVADEKNIDDTDKWNGWSTIGEGTKKYLSSVGNSSYKRDNILFDELIVATRNNQNVAYVCLINGSKHVVINGKISEPYDKDCYISHNLNGNNYMYNYSKNGKKFININGKSITVDCDDSDTPSGSISINGGYYYKYSKNEKNYLNVNGKTFGPYDYIDWSIDLFENGKFSFVYRKDDLYYVNNNGIISKGFLYVYDLETKADGYIKYLFSMEDGWVYENLNGQVKRTQDRKVGYGKGTFLPSIEKYKIQSKNKSHTLSVDMSYDYVVIDGRSYGKAPAIKAWYDETKNSFVWNAWEGKELVIYEMKLD
jgi:hypothetical protein